MTSTAASGDTSQSDRSRASSRASRSSARSRSSSPAVRNAQKPEQPKNALPILVTTSIENQSDKEAAKEPTVDVVIPSERAEEKSQQISEPRSKVASSPCEGEHSTVAQRRLQKPITRNVLDISGLLQSPEDNPLVPGKETGQLMMVTNRFCGKVGEQQEVEKTRRMAPSQPCGTRLKRCCPLSSIVHTHQTLSLSMLELPASARMRRSASPTADPSPSDNASSNGEEESRKGRRKRRDPTRTLENLKEKLASEKQAEDGQDEGEKKEMSSSTASDENGPVSEMPNHPRPPLLLVTEPTNDTDRECPDLWEESSDGDWTEAEDEAD
ncbi:hypothetical protein OSTOST_16982, partial [Ostertagia ostertagi]